MNVTQELKVLRLGQPPEMRFKTGEENAPVFVLRVLTSAEELEATINTQSYLTDSKLPEAVYRLIYQTERLAIALKDADGKRIFNNGTELRARFTEPQCGSLLAAYESLLLHYKTMDTIKEDELRALIEGVATGKPMESI